MTRTSKARAEQGKNQIQQCSHPGKHTLHEHSVLNNDKSITSYTCPGVGATLICSACRTVNLKDAVTCKECGLRL